jgi:hypothetical protein
LVVGFVYGEGYELGTVDFIVVVEAKVHVERGVPVFVVEGMAGYVAAYVGIALDAVNAPAAATVDKLADGFFTHVAYAGYFVGFGVDDVYGVGCDVNDADV